MKNYWHRFFLIIQAFFLWWTTTLFGLLPAAVKDRLGRKKANIVLIIQDSDIIARQEKRETCIGALSPSPDGPSIEWDKGMINAFDPAAGVVSLQFAARWGFWQKIPLPPMDAQDAARALELQLNQYSPLELGKIHHGYRFKTDQNKTLADLVLVKREKVEAVLQAVLHQGFSVSGVTISSQDEEAIFDIRPDLTARKKKALVLKGLLLAAIPVLALILAYTITVNKYEQAHLALDQKIQAARVEAEAIREKRAALLQENKRQKLISTLFERPSLPLLVEAFSQLTPQGAWVRELRQQGDKVSLVGQADDLGLLVQKMEESDLIAQVNITTSNTTAQQGRNEFILDLQLKSGEGE